MTARTRLPNRRAHEVIEFEHRGLRCRGGVGRYEDGNVAELFLTVAKDGSQADVNGRDAAIAASLALQFGCSLEQLQRALLRNPDGTAAGPLTALIDRLVPLKAVPSVSAAPGGAPHGDPSR
jgi:ribonucleoside-diphosphate reductase alpha chain